MGILRAHSVQLVSRSHVIDFLKGYTFLGGAFCNVRIAPNANWDVHRRTYDMTSKRAIINDQVT